MAWTIVSSSFSKSIASSLSASSSTRYRTPFTEKPRVFCRWSTSRPGVPTTRCGRLASRIACCTMSTPPTTTATLTPIIEPSASSCSPICSASSRVGEMMRPKSGWGASSSRLSTGRPKAAVFPEPVSARPMTSRPASAHGIASHWMAVGALKFIFWQASQSGSARPSSLKVLGAAAAIWLPDSPSLSDMNSPDRRLGTQS
mmetsp:Transcript_22477/g.74117  ORF Transcript_22477/g.74117 Transcript_22477/m.74117 type:complete len:201 (-) Transcript_22477:19-621(-)